MFFEMLLRLLILTENSKEAVERIIVELEGKAASIPVSSSHQVFGGEEARPRPNSPSLIVPPN
jgi:hypothetical protein